MIWRPRSWFTAAVLVFCLTLGIAAAAQTPAAAPGESPGTAAPAVEKGAAGKLAMERVAIHIAMKRSAPTASPAAAAVAAAGAAARSPDWAAGFALPSAPAVPRAGAAATTRLPAKLYWAALGGGVAGALVGTRGLSFTSVPPDQRTIHEWRAGITYGLIGSALGAAATLPFLGPAPEAPHAFFFGRQSTPLLAGIVAVHVLDYTGTRYFRDRGQQEALLTNPLVDNRSKFIATEAAAVAGAFTVAYLLHRTGHHRLERLFEAGYITTGAVSAYSNYRLGNTGHSLF